MREALKDLCPTDVVVGVCLAIAVGILVGCVAIVLGA